MCNYKTWFYEDKIGYVIECDDCKKLQVGFGNVLMSFMRADFEIFRQHISTVRNKEYPVMDPGTKHIFIPTACKGLTLLLNTKELEDLHYMIENTDNEIKAQQLIGLFNDQ